MAYRRDLFTVDVRTSQHGPWEPAPTIRCTKNQADIYATRLRDQLREELGIEKAEVRVAKKIAGAFGRRARP